jgi:hypothetical protein
VGIIIFEEADRMLGRSIDPAIVSTAQFAGMSVVQSLVIDENQVYVFDFDGVLSSGIEDAVYRLPIENSDEALVQQVAKKLNVKCAGMETRYQRHLVYQGALSLLDMPIAPGPALNGARVASRTATPVFIISARSGWFAVERMRKFLVAYDVFPLEIFNVGRVTKEKQVQLLANEFPSRTIVFVEDSITHLERIARVGLTNVNLMLITPEEPTPDEHWLHAHFVSILRQAMSV